MERKFLFIVNPKSGKKNSESIIACIDKTFAGGFPYKIALWSNIAEFSVLIEEIKNDYTDIVAVGGDGSVNLVGRSVMNSELTLGIIPTGSGNGLARSLGISLNPTEALQQIIDSNTQRIDVGDVNGEFFFCTSGVGFDAHIGKLFADLKTRGLKTYIKLIVNELFSYSPEEYCVIINGKEKVRKAFFITVANAGQFGNNFYIAPQAKLNDGLFNLVIVKPFNLLIGIGLLIRIVLGKADTSNYIESIVCDHVVIKRQKKGCIHFDGEPFELGEELKYTIHPKSLKVIIGNKFDGL